MDKNVRAPKKLKKTSDSGVFFFYLKYKNSGIKLIMWLIASCSIDYKAQHLPQFKNTIMNVKERLGERICELRKAQSLSQEKLALKANIDRAYMHLIEKGKTNVSIELIEKIANALEINIRNLFEEDFSEK